MPYPRFTKVIIHHFLSKNKSVSKRRALFMNSIKDDVVLGRLKFVSKRKDNQVYGMSIPDVMVNDDIKNSKAYKTYLAISTSIVVSKKARKGMKSTDAPKKKGSITAVDNIIPNPEEALKLGKSINRTKAEEKEEARRVHETHERLVTEKPTSDEASGESDDEQEGRLTGRIPTGVVIKDTLNVSMKKILDQSYKLKASRHAYRIQRKTRDSNERAGITPEIPDEPKGKSTGSNEGAGITPEVLDKPNGKSVAQDDDWGYDEEEVILSSDDERTESEKETVKSEKADEETTDEDEHDDADEEMNNAENADEVKKDQEMADAEKNEKTKLPPSTSSLSLSSDYNNQFLNLSSDVSLVNTVKETTDTEINSLLDTVRLEKKVEPLSKVDHFEAIKESVQANVINKVKNQLPKFLPKAVSNFVNPRIESTVREVLQTTPAFLDQSSSTPGQSSSSAVESLSEYELKKILFNKMDISRSYMTHDKHQELYDDLLNSMCLDDAIKSSQVNPDKVIQKRHR
ncbi:hypothetical protein Tco_1421567, partial [Tanacetum coccineum]